MKTIRCHAASPRVDAHAAANVGCGRTPRKPGAADEDHPGQSPPVRDADAAAVPPHLAVPAHHRRAHPPGGGAHGRGDRGDRVRRGGGALGGRSTKKLKGYASTGELGGLEARVESAQQIVAEGFKALKLRFHSADVREDIRTLESVRKAVGDDIDIMVDGNWGWRIAPDLQPNRWDLKTAIAAAREMERYGVYWLEEP